MANMCVSLVFSLLVALPMVLYSVEASPVDGELLFDSNTLYETLKMPRSCKEQSYCFDEGENYPHQIIDELLTDMRDLKVGHPESRTNFGSRYADTYDEADCPANSTENPIFYIIDKNDKVRVVVQSKEKFQQIYTIKWCRDEGLITRDTPHFLKNTTLQKFKIECISNRMDFDFFVLSDEVDPDTGRPMMEIATAKGGIPVCCRCRYDAEH